MKKIVCLALCLILLSSCNAKREFIQPEYGDSVELSEIFYDGISNWDYRQDDKGQWCYYPYGQDKYIVFSVTDYGYDDGYSKDSFFDDLLKSAKESLTDVSQESYTEIDGLPAMYFEASDEYDGVKYGQIFYVIQGNDRYTRIGIREREALSEESKAFLDDFVSKHIKSKKAYIQSYLVRDREPAYSVEREIDLNYGHISLQWKQDFYVTVTATCAFDGADREKEYETVDLLKTLFGNEVLSLHIVADSAGEQFEYGRYNGMEYTSGDIYKQYYGKSYNDLAQAYVQPLLDVIPGIGEEVDEKIANAENDIAKDTVKLKLVVIGLNDDEAAEVAEIFSQIGITKIDNVQPGAGTGIDNLQSYVAEANGDPNKKFYFTFENRKLFYVGYGEKDLYDNGVVGNINE